MGHWPASLVVHDHDTFQKHFKFTVWPSGHGVNLMVGGESFSAQHTRVMSHGRSRPNGTHCGFQKALAADRLDGACCSHKMARRACHGHRKAPPAAEAEAPAQPPPRHQHGNSRIFFGGAGFCQWGQNHIFVFFYCF